MMKCYLLTISMAAVIFCGAATAGVHGGGADTAKLEKALRTAFVLSLAEEMQLDEAQTLALVRSYQQHSGNIATLSQRQTELRGQLMGGGQSAQAQLDQLIQGDQQLAQAQAQAAQEVGADLSPEQRAKVYLLLSTMDEHVSAVLGGKKEQGSPHAAMAAHAGEAPAPAEQAQADPATLVKQAVAQWAEGIKAQKVEQMILPFSDNFKHPEYGDKAGVRDFLQQAADMGYLEGTELVMDEAKVDINGEEARMHPVRLNGSFGQATIDFTLKNEGGTWRIVGMDISGV